MSTNSQDWVTFRVRGGDTVQDAFFARAIETPVTEEIQLQFKQDLGRNMMFEINLIDRETSDIAEDYGRIFYDIDQYAEVGDPNAPGHPLPGPRYFGFPDLATIDQVRLNFMIGTLAGGNRDWQGAEFVFRKRYSNNWQMLASYNWADAEGNTNSDSNFDGAGDCLPVDPRAPTAPAYSRVWWSTCSRSAAPTTGTTVSRSAPAIDGIPACRSTATAVRRSAVTSRT